MDVRFTWDLQRRAGAKGVLLDKRIRIRHLHTFEIDESYENRFDDWMEPGVGHPDICRYEEQP